MKPPKIQFDSKTFKLILSGLLVLFSLGFFIIAFNGLSLLEKKSSAMVQLRTQSQTAQNQLNNLQIVKKEVQKYSYFKSVADTVIPNDKDQAEAVLEIYQMAQQSGISLQSVTFPTSTLGETAQSATGSGATQAALSQAKPVPGIPGLYSLQLTITPLSGTGVPASQQVTYAKMLNFLKLIENDRRTAQITQVQIQPGQNASDLSFTLIINIFIKP